MNLDRRAFIAALFAPFVAKLKALLPKRQLTIVDLLEARMNEAYLRMHEQLVKDLYFNGQGTSVADLVQLDEWYGGGTYIQEPFTYGGLDRFEFSMSTGERREIKGGIITS